LTISAESNGVKTIQFNLQLASYDGRAPNGIVIELTVSSPNNLLTSQSSHIISSPKGYIFRQHNFTVTDSVVSVPNSSGFIKQDLNLPHGNLDLHIKLVQFDPKPRSYFSIARKDDLQNLGDSSLPKVVDCLRSLLGINRIDTSDFKIKANDGVVFDVHKAILIGDLHHLF
jgi:hypothetical protein